MHSELSPLHPRSPRRGWRPAALSGLLLAGALALTGCSSPSAPDGGAEASDPGGIISIPETPVGEQLSWMLELLNGEADITAEHLDGRFTDTFVAAAPLPELAETLNSGVRPAKPFKVTAFEGISDELGAARITGATSDSLSLEMRVTGDGTISEMLVRPATAK